MEQEELDEEFLYAARVGDLEEMVKWLDSGADLKAVGGSGNSGLHMACANGRTECVKELLKRGADTNIQNAAGNTPMHYAAQQQQAECLKLLCETEKSDVLRKNEFGRSVLTDAIATGSGELATIVLEHNSATEERLIDGIDAHEKEEAKEVKHEMCFASDTLKQTEAALLIRELVITKTVVGTFESGDRTGLGIWAASLILARWVTNEARQKNEFRKVIELGAGCGLPGLAFAQAVPEARVLLTDFNQEALANAAFNAKTNCERYKWCDNVGQSLDFDAKVSIAKLDWTADYQLEADLVIGADLVYSSELVPALTKTIASLASEFWYVAPADGRAGADDFLHTALPNAGFIYHSVQPAPTSYLASPLLSSKSTSAADENRDDDNDDDDASSLATDTQGATAATGASSSSSDNDNKNPHISSPFLLYFPDMLTSSFLLHRFSKHRRQEEETTVP